MAELVKYIEYAVWALLLGVVCVPALWVMLKRRRDLATPGEWDELARRLSSESPEDLRALDKKRYCEVTRGAVGLILGREIGQARTGQIGLAVELLVTPYEERALALRGLAGQAVIIGLFGTVCVLAYTLKDMSPDTFRSNLQAVYRLNAFAVCLAIVLGGLQAAFRGRGHRVQRAALAAMTPLSEQSLDENVAGALGRSLELVLQTHRADTDRLLRENYTHVEAQLTQMNRIADALENTLGRIFGGAPQKAQEQVQLGLRELRVEIDQLVVTLDRGFSLLAAPFVEGPALTRELRRVVEELSSAAARIADAPYIEAAEKIVGPISRALAQIETEVKNAGESAAIPIRETGSNVIGELQRLREAIEHATCAETECVISCVRGLETTISGATARVVAEHRSLAEDVRREISGGVATLDGRMVSVSSAAIEAGTKWVSEQRTSGENVQREIRSGIEIVGAALVAEHRSLAENVRREISGGVATLDGRIASVSSAAIEAGTKWVSEQRTSDENIQREIRSGIEVFRIEAETGRTMARALSDGVGERILRLEEVLREQGEAVVTAVAKNPTAEVETSLAALESGVWAARDRASMERTDLARRLGVLEEQLAGIVNVLQGLTGIIILRESPVEGQKA